MSSKNDEEHKYEKICNENNNRYKNVSLVESIRTINHHYSHTHTPLLPIGQSRLAKYSQQTIEPNILPHKQFTQ